MQPASQISIDLPGIQKLRSGKVREVLISARRCSSSSRIAFRPFDVILPDPIPCKGRGAEPNFRVLV